ncbi:MAG: hypothetical protein II877_10380, partial [Synergistaceae bacterium]|nr:hypothetical protein [Synergistaceae bacterium]
MRTKFYPALLVLFILLFAAPSLGASYAIIMNGDAHVGEQAVLSVEASQIPSGGSVEWSVSPTTGLTPYRISLRAGGRECAFTPLDTHSLKVVASFIDRDGNMISSTERMITPKEFQINIAVVAGKPLTLWNASERSDYELSPDTLMEGTPIRIRASLNPPFKGEHTLKWTGDAATALMSPDKDDIFIRRGSV